MKRHLLVLAVLLVACQRSPVAPTIPPPVVTPDPIPAPVPVNPHHYGRPLHSGPFYATDQRYGFYDTPGTIEVILAGTDPARQVGSRLIVADNEDPLGWGRSADRVPCEKLAAVYLNVTPSGIGGGGGDGDAELPRARARADACAKPVLVYYDVSGTLDLWVRTLLRPGDIIGVNAYPSHHSAGEDLARDLAKIAHALDVADSWGHPVALVRPFYTRTQEWSLELILAMQVPLTDLVRAHPSVVMDLWFSWSRPDLPQTAGALDYPELQQHAAWLDEAARTGR